MYTMGFYSGLRENGIIRIAGTWVGLEGVKPGDLVSGRQKARAVSEWILTINVCIYANEGL